MRHDDFVPLALGIRLSVGDSERSHGLFIEASPAAYLAWFHPEGVEPSTKLLAGFQAGWGMRVPAFGASHAELGMNYYRSENAALKDGSVIGAPPERGFGGAGIDALAFYVTFGVGR